MSERLESDGIDDAYFDRNQAVMALARLAQVQGYQVGWKDEDPDDPEWRILFIGLPTGQVSWHIKTEDMIGRWPYYDGDWDGHTLNHKRDRMAEFINGVPRWLETKK